MRRFWDGRTDDFGRVADPRIAADPRAERISAQSACVRAPARALLAMLLATSGGGAGAVRATAGQTVPMSADLLPARLHFSHRTSRMRLVGVVMLRWALIMTSVMTSRAAAPAAAVRRHDDVIVAPGRCLVRCLTLFQVRSVVTPLSCRQAYRPILLIC